MDLDTPVQYAEMEQSVGNQNEETKETIRTFFPETWIWELVSVG